MSEFQKFNSAKLNYQVKLEGQFLESEVFIRFRSRANLISIMVRSNYTIQFFELFDRKIYDPSNKVWYYHLRIHQAEKIETWMLSEYHIPVEEIYRGNDSDVLLHVDLIQSGQESLQELYEKEGCSNTYHLYLGGGNGGTSGSMHP